MVDCNLRPFFHADARATLCVITRSQAWRMTMPAPIRLYRHVLSGHCHRVELMLSLLGLPFEPVEMEFGPTGTRSPPFLSRNAFGQVPVNEDDGLTLADRHPTRFSLFPRHHPPR